MLVIQYADLSIVNNTSTLKRDKISACSLIELFFDMIQSVFKNQDVLYFYETGKHTHITIFYFHIIITIFCISRYFIDICLVFLDGRRGEYWTSGNDLTWEGVWAWAEFDYHIMEEAFDNWAPNRPSIDSRRNCLYIRYDGGSAMWYDGNCQLRKHALCFG